MTKAEAIEYAVGVLETKAQAYCFRLERKISKTERAATEQWLAEINQVLLTLKQSAAA